MCYGRRQTFCFVIHNPLISHTARIHLINPLQCKEVDKCAWKKLTCAALESQRFAVRAELLGPSVHRRVMGVAGTLSRFS